MILDKEKFKDYLKGLGYQTCGVSGDAAYCPIAKYFRSLGYINLDVNDEEYSYTGEDEEYYSYDMPEWASKFVQQVDSDEDGRYMAANDLLSMLD